MPTSLDDLDDENSRKPFRLFKQDISMKALYNIDIHNVIYNIWIAPLDWVINDMYITLKPSRLWGKKAKYIN